MDNRRKARFVEMAAHQARVEEKRKKHIRNKLVVRAKKPVEEAEKKPSTPAEEAASDKTEQIVGNLYPAGAKFEPSDEELLHHLEAEIGSASVKPHPLIKNFTSVLSGEDGMFQTHPKHLPGVKQDGSSQHFFHRIPTAYTPGTRKRRKTYAEDDGEGVYSRWYKTGKTRSVTENGHTLGWKKMMVLYENYGTKKAKTEKTNWVLYQYHIGESEEETNGELVVCKVFYQKQPRQFTGGRQAETEKADLIESLFTDDSVSFLPEIPQGTTPVTLKVPRDTEIGMAWSLEDIEFLTHPDQEGAGKSKVWAQEEFEEPITIPENQIVFSNQSDFLAEEFEEPITIPGKWLVDLLNEDDYATAIKEYFVAEDDAKKSNVTDEDIESNRGTVRPRNHLGHGKQQEVVKDFIREINGGRGGFVVSKAWLLSLEEPHKGTVMSVLRRAGYLEVHRTRTAIIYRRIENSTSQVEASDVLDSEKRLQLDIVRSDDCSRFFSRSLPDEGKTALTSSNEKVETFKTALKQTGPQGYSVSTQWLSTLSDREVEDLNAALSKAGYFQLHKTSTTTYFKRHECVNNNPGSRRESRSTAVTIRRDSGRPSTSQGTKFSIPEKPQDFNVGDDTKVTSKIQERQKLRLDCDCVPQYLTVSCTPPFQSPAEASTSSSQGLSKHVSRHRIGDCHVTKPQKVVQRIMNTRADKSTELKAVDFDDMKSYVKTYLLDVSAETSLCCCLMSVENAKKVRFEFLKIQGALKMEESMKPESGLVLKALRTNVVAYITKAEQSEGSEHMPLRPRFEDLELLQSDDDSGQTRRPVGLEISAKDPKDSDPGSTTLELQCLEAHCTDSDLNHELLFSNFGPRVIFEGDLHADHHQNSLLELNVRYQLEICHDEYDDSLPHVDYFVGTDRKIMNVDFNCILEFSCRVT